MFNFLRRPPKVVEAPVMTTEDKAVVWHFAENNKGRDEAIAVHRKYIPILGGRGTIEQDFMSEIDTVCPDYRLREHYRLKVLTAICSKDINKIDIS